jgi:hypothetical protein
MMAPAGSNGDAGPTSTTKPLSLPLLFHLIVVPTFTQKSELPLAFGMLGVEDAESAVRFTSTLQGLEEDPHVLALEHSCAGFGSEQTYLLSFDSAFELPRNSNNIDISEIHLTAKHRQNCIMHLGIRSSTQPAN